MTASGARELTNIRNKEYDNNVKLFSELHDEKAFTTFILKRIEEEANHGCSSFEWEMKSDLRNTSIINSLKELKYKVDFYKLNEAYSNGGYCLRVSW